MRTSTPFFLLLVLTLMFTGCGVRGSVGQTVAEFEKSNPAYTFVPPAKISGTSEIREYRNWSWTSPWSYVKPSRTRYVLFENGLYVSTVNQ